MKNLLKRRGKWLFVLGLALLLFSMYAINRVPEYTQYIFNSPIEKEPTNDDDAASELKLCLDRWNSSLVDLGGTGAFISLNYGYSMSSNVGSADSGTLTGVDMGYSKLYPKYLLEGRWFMESELSEGAKVAVLDSELAFKLFPSSEATRGSIIIDGEDYRVIGVVRHSRSAGDMDEYGAYVPVSALADMRCQTEFVMLAADPKGIAGVTRSMNDISVKVSPGGDMYELSKEIMRRTMIARVLTILFSLYILKSLMRAVNGRLAARIITAKEDMKSKYLSDILPGMILSGFIFLVLYAALAGAAYATLMLSIRPLYVFTEWVPEIAVEWSSYAKRISGLLIQNAQPNALITPEIAALRVYGALLRWGVICLMCAFILGRRPIEK